MPPRIQHYILSCFSHSSWIWQFLTFLVFDDLDSLRTQAFCRMSLNWDLSDVFLMMRLGLWVWGKRPQRRSATVITSYQGYLLSTCLITGDVDRHLAEAVFVRLLHCEVPPSSYFRIVLFGRKSLCSHYNIFFYTYIRSCFPLTNSDLLEALIFTGSGLPWWCSG